MATKPRILVVEDEETLLDMYELKFEASGFVFFGAATGEEGIAIVEREDIDLVMVDLMLENKAVGGIMDGYETIRKLRAHPRLKAIKICALTNLDQEKNIEDAKAAGADAYLVKSDLTPTELVAKAQAILSGESVGLMHDEK